METEPVFKKLKDDMQKSVDHVLSEFATLHTGKANPSMVDGVAVDVYGSSMKLRDVAAITTPDSRTIQIQAWDKSTVAPIEKALIDAKLGINPVVTGELIRLPIPELSGERGRALQNGSGLCRKWPNWCTGIPKRWTRFLKSFAKRGTP